MYRDKNLKKLRREALLSDIVLLDDLQEKYGDQLAYKEVLNPALQNVYLKQIEFVLAYSSSYLNKEVNELKILDWGSGKGVVSYVLNKKGVKNLKSCEMQEFGHTDIVKDKGIKVDSLDDQVKLPYKDEQFDVVLSFGVLEHAPFDQLSLIEINRVLDNQGIFICFNLPYRYGYSHRAAHMRGNYYHDRLYDKKSVKWLLDRSGFVTIGKPWHRQLLPRNTLNLAQNKFFDSLDTYMTEFTPFMYVATNIEFVAKKQTTLTQPH